MLRQVDVELFEALCKSQILLHKVNVTLILLTILSQNVATSNHGYSEKKLACK